MDYNEGSQNQYGIPRFIWGRSVYLGWWVLGAITLVSFSRVVFLAPVAGVFVVPLEDEFGWSRTTIALALSIGSLLGALSTLIVGRLLDRHGGRYFLTGTMAIAGCLLILLSTVEEVWQFYLYYGVGRGLMIGVIDVAIIVTIANWFIRYRGRAMGVMLVGLRMAFGIMPFIVLAVISAADFRAAFAALGVLILVLGVIPPYLVVRRRPEDLGLRPDGAKNIALNNTPSKTDRHANEDSDINNNDPHWSAREAIRTRAFWLLLIGTSQLYLVGGAVNFSMASHFEDSGLLRSTAITLVGIWAFTGITGGLIGGELRQRLSIRVALPAVLLVNALLLIWLSQINTSWMAYAFAIGHGITFGVQQPLNQIAFPDYFGRWSIGAIRGITAPVQYGINTIGTPIAALVFDLRGSFDLIYIIFAIQLTVAAVLIMLAKRPQHSSKAT